MRANTDKALALRWSSVSKWVFLFVHLVVFSNGKLLLLEQTLKREKKLQDLSQGGGGYGLTFQKWIKIDFCIFQFTYSNEKNRTCSGCCCRVSLTRVVGAVDQISWVSGVIRLPTGNQISLLFSLLQVFTTTTLLVQSGAKCVDIMFSIWKELQNANHSFVASLHVFQLFPLLTFNPM